MTIANIAPIVGHEWTEVLIMKLIDADALLRALPDDLPYKGSVRRVLMQAPEVDAVPVVHGRWEQDADCDWYCTNCDEVVAICDSGRERTYRKPYCPNCGAKMDGGDGNEA